MMVRVGTDWSRMLSFHFVFVVSLGEGTTSKSSESGGRPFPHIPPALGAELGHLWAGEWGTQQVAAVSELGDSTLMLQLRVLLQFLRGMQNGRAGPYEQSMSVSRTCRRQSLPDSRQFETSARRGRPLGGEAFGLPGTRP